ncbi:GGDEF domain-containing protein [Pseudoalteromonas sp. SMS1]|uniref:GGDEF domain-containing protein n=1 Tax=Pseudoalteromonas sp. SMS1 TaxID=2908894 RepID=UPI001F27C036|nr:GGDEF domain-containing protein [Pseudoalteromonas sp. SMS1]MCF2858104.1 GGDEF domain-containing protein [Pseudoalteromonas sp. SMS1]
MQVHDLTIMLSLFIASLTGSIVLMSMARMSQKVEGARYWAVALAVLSLAYLSQFSMQSFPRAILVTMFNTCLIIGHSLWLIGAWHFVYTKPSHRRIAVLIVPVLTLSFLFTVIIPDREWRLAVIGIWLICVRAHYGWVLWQHAKHDKNEYLATQITVAVVILEITLSALYTLYGAFGSLPNIGSNFSWVGGYTWLVALIGIVAGTPLLMLLSAGRFVRKLEYSAHHDELTDLLNRHGLSKNLENILPLTKRKCDSFAVIMLDVDHFKYVNDTYGHTMGDAILAALGSTLKSQVRSSDLVVRWGGEEFCIILFDITPTHTLQLSEKIREAFSHNAQHLSPEFITNPVTVSAGLAFSSTVSRKHIESTQALADRALYLAKKNGRNRSELYSDEEV